MNAIIEAEGWKFVFVLRLSPFAPIEALIYACSVTSISFAHHALGVLGSIVPITFVVWSSASASSMAGGNTAKGHGHTVLLVIMNLLIFAGMVALAKHSYGRYQAASKVQASEAA